MLGDGGWGGGSGRSELLPRGGDSLTLPRFTDHVEQSARCVCVCQDNITFELNHTSDLDI